MFEELFKVRGSKTGRGNQKAAFSYENIIGVNYVDSPYAMQPNQSPYAVNMDFGYPFIGSMRGVRGYEALFPSLGEGRMLGLHNFKHSKGDYLLAAWDKYLHVLTGDTGVISQTSQADWDTWTLTDIDTASGDMKLEAGVFSDVVTTTADFGGTHNNTQATGDRVSMIDVNVFYSRIIENNAIDTIIKTLTSSSPRTEDFTSAYANLSRVVVYKMATNTVGNITIEIFNGSTRLGSQTYTNITASGDTTFDIAVPITIPTGVTLTFKMSTTGSYRYREKDGGNKALSYSLWANQPKTGTYTHGILDPSAEGKNKDLYITYHKTEPVGTYATVQYRLSSNSGATWEDWTNAQSGDVLIPAGTVKTGYRLQWRCNFTTNINGVKPSLNDVSVLATNASRGEAGSPVYDLGYTPATANLVFTQTVPDGCSAVWYARASGNGTVFGDWQEVLFSGDPVPRQRYVQLRAVLTSPSPYVSTPVVSGLVLTHTSEYTQARRLSIEPLGRTNDLLTGNRMRFVNYGDWCVIADGLRPFILYVEDGTQESGTTQGSGEDSITLQADASEEDDWYNNALITITGGPGEGQIRWITDYDGETKRATVSEAWETELAAANLLTDNQASVETDLTGFSVFSSATISRDTTEKWHGTASLKVVTPGAVEGEGVYTTLSQALAAGDSYTGSAWVKGNGTVRLLLRERTGGVETDYTSDPVTLTGDWQRLVVAHPVADALNTQLLLAVRTIASVQAVTFYVDGLQLEKRSSASDWHLPSDTSEASTYSIGPAFKVRNAGIDPPVTAPSGAASTESGSPSGSYLLKYTFVNEDGVESNPSPASASVSVSGKKITWTVPVDAAPYNRTASRRLYRTAAGGAVYKYVGEIDNNTGTTFTDNLSDTALGSLMADNNNAPPASCSLVTEFTSYLFYIDTYDVWFSKAGSPDQVPNIPGDIQQMTFPGRVLDIKAHPTALIIGGEDFMATITSNTGFIFDSDPVIDTTTTKVIDKYGSMSAEGSAMCLSPDLRSTLLVPTLTGIRATIPGLQDNSIESVPLSRNIQPYYDRGLNRDQSAAVFWNNYYIYSMEHQGAEEAEPKRITFAYDLRTKEWYGPWEFGMACYAIVDNVLYGGSTEDGKIYRLFTGSSFDGEDIRKVCDLPMRAPAGEQGTCKFKTLTVIASAESDTTETVIKPKVDAWTKNIPLGKLVDPFTGPERPGHNVIRTRKYPIYRNGHTFSLRIEDDSVNPLAIEKLIAEYDTLNINK